MPSAHAACADKPVYKASATKQIVKGQRAPLAIGDSTMIFSVKYLTSEGFDVNARECRSWAEGLDVIRARKRAGRLPSLVVMALGANSWVRPIDVERALKLLGPKRILGLPTHRTWAGKQGPDTRVIRRMARKHRKQIKLIDWVRYAKPHPEWFRNGDYDDGLHPNQTGAEQFANYIAAQTVS